LPSPHLCSRLIDACSKRAALDIGADRGAFNTCQGLGPTRNICEFIPHNITPCIYTLKVVIAVHVLLYFFDSLPLAHLVFSIICHVVYLQNFTPAWPLISLSSLTFILSCVLVVADHFMWFFYFSRLTSQSRNARGRMYRGPNSSVPGFSDIATFFALCVWLAPLFLFLSLSAGENTLPTVSGKQVFCVDKATTKRQSFHRFRGRSEHSIHPSDASPPASWFPLQNPR
jgi:hypothetical protein